jgi:hypothetical protein
MSTGPEHYRAAEEILADAQKVKNTMATEGDWEPLEVAAALQTRYGEAQVHATLALAAATAELDTYEGPTGGTGTGRSVRQGNAWGEAFGGETDG